MVRKDKNMKNRNYALKAALQSIRAVLLILFSFNFAVFPVTSSFAADLPQGPDVKIGSPSIASNGIEMTIDAGTHNKTWIDWQGGFNIGVENIVNNIGPNAAAAILHNDVSGAISSIQGVLNGNCNVFLLNPSGILFSPTAQINTAGFVSSTLMMSQDDFVNGNYVFRNEVLTEDLGSIINQGAITAEGPGGVTMIAGSIENTGLIKADLGNINLLNGEEVTLAIDGAGYMKAVVNKELLSNIYDKDGNQIDTGLDNAGDIIADGAQIYMQTEAVEGVFETLINQEGIVRAGSMVERDGKIIITSDSEGIVQNSGTLDVSGIEEGANGGTLVIEGSMVGQFGEARADGMGEADGGNINLYAEDVVALGSNSLTTANAGTIGDGGEIIVYSPETALFWRGSEIQAKGGSVSGDGGFVEVSGKQHIEINGMVDTSAFNGLSGTFLIDPTDITIIAGIWGAGDITDDTDGTFTATGVSNTLADGTIEHYLNLGTSVTVTTDSGFGAALAHITQNADAPIAFTGDGGATSLTLVAADHIILNGGITASGAALNLTLTANSDAGGTGNVDINAAVGTNGGTFTTSGIDFDNTAGVITTGDGAVDLNFTGDILVGANIDCGDIDILATDQIDANNGAQLIADGDVTIEGTGIGHTGGQQYMEISGDSSGDSVLTLTLTAANTVDLRVLTDQFNTINVNSQDTNDNMDIDLPGVDIITIDGNGLGTIGDITNVVLTNTASAFTYTQSDTEGMDIDDIDVSTGDVSITLSSGGTLDVQEDQGGISATGAANITLVSSGPITVSDPVTTSGGNIFLTTTSSDQRITHDADSISAAAGTVTLRADDMTLSGTSITGNGGIYIYTKDTDTIIQLGDGGAVGGQLELSEAMLQTLASTGTLTIGENGVNTGAIEVNGSSAIDLSGESFNVTLVTEGAIDNTTGGTNLFSIPDTKTLVLDANTTIGATNRLYTGATVVDADARGGNLTLDNTGAVTDLQLNADSGNIDFINHGTINTGAAITANDVSIVTYGDMTIDQAITADSGDVLLDANSSIDITNAVTGVNVYLAATEYVDVEANITSTAGNIALRADSDGGGEAGDDLNYIQGTISATGGYVYLMGDDVTLDVAGDATQTGGISASGASSVTPPDCNMGITVLAQNDIVVNTTLTTTNSNGNVIISSDADMQDMSGLPDAILQTAGEAPDGTGDIDFNTDTGADVLGAGVTAEKAISLTGINITVDQTGMTFDADGTQARAGSAVGTPVLYSTAGFAALAGDSLDLNAADASITTINTADSGANGNVILTADYDFNAIAAGDRQDLAVPAKAADNTGSLDADNTSIVSEGDISYTSPEAVTVNDVSTPGGVSVTSTANAINIINNSTINVGTDGTGSLTLTADTNIDIGSNCAITAGTDINLYADTTGDDAGTIDIDTGTTLAAGGDNNWTAGAGITLDGSVSQSGLLNFQTGVAAVSTGSFTLETNGAINTNGSLIIGDTSILDNIYIINPPAVGNDVVYIAGTINSGGGVTIDLETPNITGHVDFGSADNSGAIIADGNVTITLDSAGINSIQGYGNITADAITLTAAHADADIYINDLIAREWIDIDSGQDIITGALEAQENTGGYAIKLTTADGAVTINGETTANAIAGLNVYIDPATLTVNSPVNITGNYDGWATDNININANITTSGDGSRIVLLADDDGSAFPDSGAHDGTGNLIMAPGTALTANQGYITLQGESLTLYDVIAGGNTLAENLTINADINDDDGDTLTLNGILRGVNTSTPAQGVQINARGANIVINADPDNILGGIDINGTATLGTLTLNSDLKAAGAIDIAQPITLTADSTISGNLSDAGGSVTLNQELDSDADAANSLIISTGTGAVTVDALGKTTNLNSVTIVSTGITTLGDNITAENNLDLSGATNVDLGAGITLTSDSGDIYLNGGNVDGNQTLALVATQGNLYLDTIGTAVNSFTATAGGTAYLNGGITVDAGAIDMKACNNIVLQDDIELASGGYNIDLGSTRNTTLTGDFELTLTPGAVGTLIYLDDVDVATLTFTNGAGVGLFGNIVVDNNLDFSPIANGASIGIFDHVIITTNGADLTMTNEDIYGTGGGGAQNLTINAGAGAVSLGEVGASGATALKLFKIEDTSGTVTLNGAIYADGGIDLSGVSNVSLAAGSGIFNSSGNNGNIKLNGGVINADIGAAIAMVINSGSGDIYLGSIGQSDPIASLGVTSTGTTTLQGSITADGASGITFVNADDLDLGAAVMLTTDDAAGDIVFGDNVDGAYALVLSSGHDITTVAMGANVPLASLDATAANEFTVGGAITTVDTLRLIATADDVNIGGGLIGSDVSVTATAGNIELTAAQNNTSGSTTLTAGTEIDIDNTVQALNDLTLESASNVGANLTAGQDLTINGAVTLSGGARTLTATDGDIDLNAAIDGAFDLTLTADNGTVYTQAIGTTADVGALDINSDSAEINGNIEAVSIDTTGIGLATLTSDISMDASGAAGILLGDLDGAHSLTLSATNAAGVITLRDADIQALIIDDAINVNFAGDFVTSGAVTVNTAIGGEIDIAATKSIQAGGAVILDDAVDIDINGTISGDSVTLDTTGNAITLAGNVSAANGNVSVTDDQVTVDGNSIVSSTNGDVGFGGAVLDGTNNTHTLEINANNGTATFTGAVGGAADLSSLTVTAGDTLFSSTTEVGTGGLTVTGVGTSTTTISGNVTSSGDVLYDDSVTIAGGGTVTIDTATNNSSIEITGKTDGTTANTETLVIEAGSGAVTFGDSIGTTTTLATLQIDTSGQTELNGAIRVGTDLDLDEADDVQLGSDVTATVGNDAFLDVIDGAFALNIDAGNDITVNDTIGATENLASVTMTADDELNISGAIASTGQVSLTANGTVAGEDLNLGANVIGTNVILTASNQKVIVTATQNNTLGTTTYNGATTINGAAITLTSDSDMTFNDAVTVTAIGDGGITSTNGNLDFNAAIDDGGSTETLNLNAANGDIAVQVISGTLTEVDIDSLTAELGGATIDAGHFDTAGVGLTTLVADVDIDATAADGINLGDLDGAHSLTLSATNAAGVITLKDADIQALTIDDGFTTSFTGDFATTGNVDVSGITGEIDVASAGSIQAGGTVSLANNHATGIDINGAIAGAGGVTMAATAGDIAIDADVTAQGSGAIDLDATAGNVDIAQAADASVSSVDGDIDIDALAVTSDVLIGNSGVAVGVVSTTGTGDIYVDAGDANTGAITVDGAGSEINSKGTVNIGQTRTGSLVTLSNSGKIQAVGDITIDGHTVTINSGTSIVGTAGEADIQSNTAGIVQNGDITAVGNTVILTSATTITDTTAGTTSGTITARTLKLNSSTGVGGSAVNAELDTAVDYITTDVDTVTGTGNVYILENDGIDGGVTLTDISTADGLIDLESYGDTLAVSVTAGGSYDVSILTHSDLTVNTITASGDTVNLQAADGSIFDDNVNSTLITADDVSLTATSNIGASGLTGDIDTNVTTLTLAASTASGDIYITDESALVITNANTNDGSIVIKAARTANGNMTVNTVTAGGDDADVTLQTLAGAGGNNSITINGSVAGITATGDDVTLISDYNIADDGTTDTDVTASALYLKAGNDVGASTATTHLDTAVATIDDTSDGNVAGNIYILEADTVDLGSVRGLTTDSGDIYVQAAVSAAGTLSVSNITAGDDGNIDLRTQNGGAGDNDIALGYANALGDDITIVSDNNVTDKDTDSAIDLVANQLYIEAAGYFGTSGTDAGIDTDVALIDNRTGATAVASAIYINENDGVDIGATNGLTSTSGPIYITAANNADGNLIASLITVNSDAVLSLITNAGAGGLNDVLIGAITTGTGAGGDVYLISDNDISDDDTTAATDVTGHTLYLEAGGDVGADGGNQELDTAVLRIDNRSASANVHNNIYIIETDTVTVGSVNPLTTDIGDIDITSGGTMTATSITAGDDGNIYLNTTSGNIALGSLTALDDDVYLNADADITDGDAGVDVTADGFYLTAVNVGTSGDYVDTKVSTIDDYSALLNTTTNIYISEYDGINLGSIHGLTTDAGHIGVTSNSTADGTLIATVVTAGGSGNITLTSQQGEAMTGNINDISVGLVTAVDDDVTLNSNDDIIDLSLDSAADVVASQLYLAANGSVGADASSQELDTAVVFIDDMAAANTYEAMYIIETDGATLGATNGLSTDTGDIDITAANSAAGDMTATSVTAGGAGNILLITLDGGSGTNDIAVGSVTAADDDVSLVSDAAITDGDAGVDITASALYLQTQTSVGTLADYIDTRVSTIDDYTYPDATAGNVGTDLYINEYDGVTLGSLNLTSGLSTDDGEIRIIGAATAAGTLTATLVTAGGAGNDIYLTTADGGSANNNIAIGLITAVDDDVWLDSDYNVTDSNLDSAADVVASKLYLDIGGSVGASGTNARLDTTVEAINDYSIVLNTTDNIYINETDSVTLGCIYGLSSDNGLIDIQAGGNIYLCEVTSPGELRLNSMGGDILKNSTGTNLLTAGGKTTLSSDGVIGTKDNPVNVDIDGPLWVWAGSERDGLSVVLKGFAGGGQKTQRAELFEPTPPGLVIFYIGDSYRLMGGGNYGSGSYNGSILNKSYGAIALAFKKLFDDYYDRSESPWASKFTSRWNIPEGISVIGDSFLNGPPAPMDFSAIGIDNVPYNLQVGDSDWLNEYYVIKLAK